MAKDELPLEPSDDPEQEPEQSAARHPIPDDAWSGDGDDRQIKREWISAQTDRRSRLALALKGRKRG